MDCFEGDVELLTTANTTSVSKAWRVGVEQPIQGTPDPIIAQMRDLLSAEPKGRRRQNRPPSPAGDRSGSRSTMIDRSQYPSALACGTASARPESAHAIEQCSSSMRSIK